MLVLSLLFSGIFEALVSSTTVNKCLDEKERAKERIVVKGREYFVLNKIMDSRQESSTTKFTICKPLIRLVVTEGNATWTLNKLTDP